MASFNRVILVGNLTRDSELRHTPAGLAVLTFTIAVNSRLGKNDDGSPVEETLFIDAVVFGKLAEATVEYLKKGKQVLLDGRLRYRTWEDSNGGKHSKHEIAVEGIQLLASPSQNQKSKKDCGEEKQLESESA